MTVIKITEKEFVKRGLNDMGNDEFIEKCKKVVSDYANKHLDATGGRTVTVDDLYAVWVVKVLQNNKALLSTNFPDGMYYEVTYNGDKSEAYVDAYKKVENVCYEL